MRPKVAAVAVTALILLVAALTAGDDNDTPVRVTVELGGPQPGVQQVTAPRPVVDQAAGGLRGHRGERNETPAGVDPRALERAREQQDRLAQSDQLPIVTPDAAPSQRGCVTRLVRNYSTRRGVRPRLLVLHYTVSPNRPGWDDVNAIVGLFDRPAFAASSNYVIDSEGNCAYIVRESDKAWTQAAANPVSISVEQVNTGREASYAGTAGLDKIGVVFSDAARRWDIPVQRGAVSGCTVTRPGIVDHEQLGPCGGGHHDISPFSVDQVIAAVRAHGAPAPVPAHARQLCQELNRLRRVKPRSAEQAARAQQLKRALAGKYVCSFGPPGRVRRR